MNLIDGNLKQEEKIIFTNGTTVVDDEEIREAIDLIYKEKLLYIYHNKSFAPVNTNCSVKVFVNGASYLADLYESMMNAKKSIWIASWAVSPELPLKRPFDSNINGHCRLQDVLEYKAKQGVKIKVLLYKEVPATLSMDSIHTKRVLEHLDENIEVFDLFI